MQWKNNCLPKETYKYFCFQHRWSLVLRMVKRTDRSISSWLLSCFVRGLWGSSLWYWFCSLLFCYDESALASIQNQMIGILVMAFQIPVYYHRTKFTASIFIKAQNRNGNDIQHFHTSRHNEEMEIDAFRHQAKQRAVFKSHFSIQRSRHLQKPKVKAVEQQSRFDMHKFRCHFCDKCGHK